MDKNITREKKFQEHTNKLLDKEDYIEALVEQIDFLRRLNYLLIKENNKLKEQNQNLRTLLEMRKNAIEKLQTK